MSVALVSGGSRGFGRALVAALAARGFRVVTDARNVEALKDAVGRVGPGVIGVPGDVADPRHRAELIDEIRALGGLDLLVNNAGILGPSPQPRLAEYPLAQLQLVYAKNVIGALGLIQGTLPWLRGSGGTVVNLTSDAAVEAYEGWGGYGSSKAALDQISKVLAAEEPTLRVYAFDPGDMRTQMHQEAFPGEDISDRPDPTSVVPALLRLLDEAPPSGRYRASGFLAARGVA